MSNETLLQAQSVTIRFGGLTAVSNFNLSIGPHELLGLIGPNGAGKTTIFNMLTGVYKPTEGQISIGGVPTTAMKPYQITSLGVARTFQNIRLFKELSVLDNVKIGGHIHYKYSGTSAVLPRAGRSRSSAAIRSRRRSSQSSRAPWMSTAAIPVGMAHSAMSRASSLRWYVASTKPVISRIEPTATKMSSPKNSPTVSALAEYP